MTGFCSYADGRSLQLYLGKADDERSHEIVARALAGPSSVTPGDGRVALEHGGRMRGGCMAAARRLRTALAEAPCASSRRLRPRHLPEST